MQIRKKNVRFINQSIREHKNLVLTKLIRVKFPPGRDNEDDISSSVKHTASLWFFGARTCEMFLSFVSSCCGLSLFNGLLAFPLFYFNREFYRFLYRQ